MGGAAFIFAHIAAPGVVEQTGGPRSILFGELDGSRTTRADAFLDELHRAEIDATVVDNIGSVLWDKYAFLCALVGVTAAARLPINELLAVPESRELFGRIVREVAMVASAEGVELADDIVDQKTAFATTLEPGSFSSLYHDLSTGHRLELDALHGELLRRAHRHRLDLPASKVVYALLKPWELANRQPATQPHSSPGEPRPECESASTYQRSPTARRHGRAHLDKSGVSVSCVSHLNVPWSDVAAGPAGERLGVASEAVSISSRNTASFVTFIPAMSRLCPWFDTSSTVTLRCIPSCANRFANS